MEIVETVEMNSNCSRRKGMENGKTKGYCVHKWIWRFFIRWVLTVLVYNFDTFIEYFQIDWMADNRNRILEFFWTSIPNMRRITHNILYRSIWRWRVSDFQFFYLSFDQKSTYCYTVIEFCLEPVDHWRLSIHLHVHWRWKWIEMKCNEMISFHFV